jgi:adenylate kinase
MCSKVNEIIDNLKTKKDMVIVEGHLAHYCEEADLVIVLRAHPSLLRKRLHAKGFNDAKVQENIEAEALDVCAFEAFQIHNDKVNEIDTSYKNPLEVRDLIIKVINGEEHFPVGKVDFLDYLDL